MEIDKDQAIIQFSKRSMDRIQAQDSQAFHISGSEMDAKFAMAKEYGQKEIDEYKKLVEEFIEKTSNMVLFKEAGSVVQEACIDLILELMTGPIFYGKNIARVPDYVFLEIRKNMFKGLILKYCNENKDGGEDDAT
jgi:hypothetical protein